MAWTLPNRCRSQSSPCHLVFRWRTYHRKFAMLHAVVYRTRSRTSSRFWTTVSHKIPTTSLSPNPPPVQEIYRDSLFLIVRAVVPAKHFWMPSQSRYVHSLQHITWIQQILQCSLIMLYFAQTWHMLMVILKGASNSVNFMHCVN